MRQVKDADGLTFGQAKFCRLVAEGRSGHDAFLEAFPKTRAKGESVDTMASRLLARVEVKSRIRELLRASRASDMDSQGEVYKDLCAAILKAEAVGNWTAYASLMRLRMSHMGMLKEHLIMSDGRFTDQNLVERLSGGDAAKAKVLWELLGRDDFGATATGDEPDEAA